ncbi:MAG: CinA family nicotinamide mononucleotide deamidase-related protein [Trueperaceae bacterium]|jgi:nicotinamide-nucleotide amidase|nr:CinA family nicotinamide mononucleotide deamidase-related protein [Truepera sp.]HRN17567.1 CinA family nicotinamide mononucleotide deamidase-related protein [Trueperaceae bacterium]HRQ09874.1 CinA family nicotinamide mononucleotide deamidase-related protein [Trueperaceae bacterium]
MKAIRSAEVIAVGTELLLGEIVDTNSARVAADLAAIGVDVYWSQRVGDNLERIAQALSGALGRSDLVVLTGGLGPTDDDVTRDAIAGVLGEEQHVDPTLEAWLRQRFAGRGRHMPESNLRQARLIPSAEVLPNPIGTAPGWLARVTRGASVRYIVTLPGPPRELERMWKVEALPRLPLPSSKLFVHTFKTIGVGESTVAEALGALTMQANPSVATYAKADGVHVRVAAKADDAEHALMLAKPTMNAVAAALGDSVWGTNGDDLPSLVLALLRARGQRVAIAEGATGGVLTGYLVGADDGTDPLARPKNLAGSPSVAPDRSGAIRGSVIACDVETMRALGVHTRLLQRLPYEAVELVAALAAAVRAFFKADIGIANLGPCVPVLAAPSNLDFDARSAADVDTDSGAPPPPGSVSGASNVVGGRPVEEERLMTKVVIAIASDSGTSVKHLDLPPLGGPWQRERTAFTSLHLIRSALR